MLFKANESFIEMIANEALKDATSDWMKKHNAKYSKDDHEYETSIKSIWNSDVKLESNKTLSPEEEKDAEVFAKEIANAVKRYENNINLDDLAVEINNWNNDEVKTSADLKKLILSLDNTLFIRLRPYKDNIYMAELYVNNSAKSPNANKFFGNHCWVVEFYYDKNMKKVVKWADAGLNG